MTIWWPMILFPVIMAEAAMLFVVGLDNVVDRDDDFEMGE